MDRYELVEGKSSKFWEVGVDGATLTVRFGRLGADGQTKAKDFSDAAAATKEKDKLVREKTGKGYALVGGGNVTTPTPPPAKVAKADATPEAETATPPSAKVDARAPSPAASAIVDAQAPAALAEEGHGLLFDGVPLPTRMRPGPRIGAAEAWGQFRERLGAVLPDDGHADWVPLMRQAIAGDLLQFDAEAAFSWARVTEAAFDLAAPKGAKEGQRWSKTTRACLEALARVVVEGSGARVAAEVATRVKFDQASSSLYTHLPWAQPLYLALRAAIVHAPEPDYDDAIDFLIAHAEKTPDVSFAVAFAFIVADDRPERGKLQPLPLLEESEKAGAKVAGEVLFLPLIADAPPAEAARWRAKHTYHLYLFYCAVDAAEVAATLIAVARAAGASALPSLDWLLFYADDEERTVVAKAILETREPGAFAALLPMLHEKWIRAAFDAAAEAYPATTLAQCLTALATGRSEPALRGRVAETIDRFGADQARAWAAPAAGRAQAYLAKLLESRDVPLADAAAWPRVLREPPWRQKTRAKDDIVLDLAPIATPFAYTPGAKPQRYTWRDNSARVLASMEELAGVIGSAESTPRSSWLDIPAASRVPSAGTSWEEALPWLLARLAEVARVRSGVYGSGYENIYRGLERQPEPLALSLWEATSALLAASYAVHFPDVLPDMMERFGERALPGLVKLVESDPLTILPMALAVDAPEIALLAARALLKLKKARTPALAWVRRHRATAVTRLLPEAIGKAGPARDAAEHALRILAADQDGTAAIDAVVARYAEAEPRVAEAVTQVLERDPLARVPSKVGKPPAWVVPSALARPILRDGGALPDAAVLTLCEMLSFTNPDEVYAGIPMVKEACTHASLGAFAFDLFSAWMAAGAPAKDGWALRAVGWLGDDSCARELTRLIRRWPGESAHQRAVTGLDVLTDIGSDVALMNLNGIAEKLKFKGLQEKARAKIAQLAEARGLTPEDLSDRLAPDLDLDERGGLDLDFGPRTFRAGFDELLRPWVKDASGQRLKDLPKPIKSDDAEKAGAAAARWGALKKDARAAASLQLKRLETMLATSRRIKPEVFWMFFAAHPLVRHLAQRLVWATFADDDPRARPSVVFRVAEDLSVTDAADEPIDLDVSPEATGLIGLVHPLHLDKRALATWGALLGDYEIAQPFPQLGRETFTLTDAETAARQTGRFAGTVVEAKRLRGIDARGWRLGDPQDGGAIIWIERDVVFPDGALGIASLSFSDGLVAGGAKFEDKEQTLGELTLGARWSSREQVSDRTFGDLDPITASEILRGPGLLAETRLR